MKDDSDRSEADALLMGRLLKEAKAAVIAGKSKEQFITD